MNLQQIPLPADRLRRYPLLNLNYGSLMNPKSKTPMQSLVKDTKQNDSQQSVAGYGPQAIARQWHLLAAIAILPAVGRCLNRDVR